MPPRRRTTQTQDVDLAAQLNELRQMMLAQQQEIGGLRAQLAQQNQGPPDAGVPPAPVNQPAALEIPNADLVIPENPIAPEVPVVPLVVPPAPLVRTPEELYDKFRCMKVPKFEGSTNPIEADNWLVDLQVILNFLRLNVQERVLYASFMLRKDARLWWKTVQIRQDVSQMTWEGFVDEFKEKYFNTEVMEAQQDEFTSFRQGNLSVAEAVKKFEQLARFCPHLIISESDKVRKMMRMFRSDLAVVISSGPYPPTTIAECVSWAIRAEIRQDHAKLPSREVKDDLLVKTATISSTVAISRKENRIQEDMGINRILPKRRMLLITTFIPLIKNMEGSSREIAVLEPFDAICVAKKAIMLGTAILISRIHRTSRKVRDISFTQHR
ncbi:hypothetical protein TIFTF001_034469 [Ficus carica]|uniref:Retrotransposon gag domain-containing protein n=1 Tax=Ficus carica TaxID=3494 RepID=A0AA88E0J6_FICCA|nr:hypothetical protein TIFTF001_034469 [Ficus carica]